jgi:ankyrin repeat protein
VVKLLLAKGANFEAANNNGITPLIIASRMGYLEVMRMLLAKGAKLGVKDKSGRTALTAAAEEGDGPAVKFLLERGAHIEKVTLEAAKDRPDVLKILQAAQADGAAMK